MSYGDKFGDLSFYVSYNRLDNDSQPMSYYYDQRKSAVGATAVNGAVSGKDILGNSALYFGDTGVEQASTDNVKFKVGYDFGDWSSLVNIAFENRNTLRNSPNSYLRDSNGATVWSGNFVQDGVGIVVPAARLGASELDRRSLSLGLRIKGELSDQVHFESNISDFKILEDNNRASSRNPADSLFNGTGETTDYHNTGWQTLEGKFVFEPSNIQGLQLISGVRYEAYRLNLDIFNSQNWTVGDTAGFTSRSGGDTSISAAFLQSNWTINPQWDLSLGGRYEQWGSSDGYFTTKAAPTVLVPVKNNSSNQFSPKFSVGFKPVRDWQLRYSLARAYRFPIVEELFTQSFNYSSVVEARPDLKPENGLHHNFMVERELDSGYVRINFFTENIQNVIESQTNLLPGGASVTTFSAIDEVKTDGAELIVNRNGLFTPNLDLRFNLAYTQSIIEDNHTAEGLNPKTTIEGNDYPRMPRWRGNLMSTYHANERWDISANLQYAEKQFGRLDNTDTAANVMGAQDGYTRLGVKTTYDFSDEINIGFGIDNLTDELSFVAHPWPGRTVYLSLSYDH